MSSCVSRSNAVCVLTLVTSDSTPEHWVPLVHPEGALYWVHDKDVSPGSHAYYVQADPTRLKPIYTDTNMCNSILRQQIEEAVEEIKKLKDTLPLIPKDWELALELGTDDKTGEPICSYYFVCLSDRYLFWLHDFGLESVLLDLPGVTENTHIRKSTPTPSIRKTKQMNRPSIGSLVLVGGRCIPATTSWPTTPRSHWERFPNKREVPEQLVQELTGILVHAGVGTSEPGLDVV